jgi:hypothetical protein
MKRPLDHPPPAPDPINDTHIPIPVRPTINKQKRVKPKNENIAESL